jgi:hypothetical protein
MLTVLDGSEFEAGDYVLVSDFTQGHLLQITSVVPLMGFSHLITGAPSGMCPILQVPFPAGGYAMGSLVVRARISRFYVDTLVVGGAPTLMMDPDGDGPAAAEPLAEGIEDLQIAVGVDVDGDDALFDDGSATDEWFYNVDGDGPPPAFTITPPRAYRVTVIARSVTESSVEKTSIRPAAEDRSAAAEPDVFRRRLLSATVEIRNLEGSL